jgi:hypothetical protein
MIYVYLIQTHNTLDSFRWMLVLASHLFTFGIVFFCKGYESAFIFIVNVAFKVSSLRLHIAKACCVEVGGIDGQILMSDEVEGDVHDMGFLDSLSAQLSASSLPTMFLWAMT